MPEFEMKVESPPETRGRPSSGLRDVACAFLVANPGQWCRVGEYTSRAAVGSAVARLNRRLRGDGYEFVARAVDGANPPTWRVYGKFTKPSQEPK